MALVAEPVALINACSLSGVWDSGHAAAVHFSLPWLCIVSAQDGELLSAESIRTDIPVGPASSPGNGEPGPIAIEVLRQWLVGDPATPRRRTPYGHLMVCGDRCCTDELVRPGSAGQEGSSSTGTSGGTGAGAAASGLDGGGNPFGDGGGVGPTAYATLPGTGGSGNPFGTGGGAPTL